MSCPLRRSVAAPLLALCACTGAIAPASDDTRAPGGGPATPAHPATRAPASMVPAAPVAPGAQTPSTAPPPPAGPPAAAVRGPLRRLTGDEYTRTVSRLFGTPSGLLDRVEFPADPGTTAFGGAELQTVTRTHVEAYAHAATLVADAVLAPAARAKAVTCLPVAAARAECVRQTAARWAPLLYRRPVDDAEVDALARLAASEAETPDPYAAVALMLRAMLQSPHFLFVVERDGALSGHEVATRLSLFLLGRGPDAALLAQAAAGALDTADGVRAAAGRLLESPEGRATLRRFFDEWLGLREVTTLERSTVDHPQWKTELARAMREETLRVLEDAAQPGRSFLDVHTARHTFADRRLARLYGIEGPADDTLVRVELTDGQRGGLVTHASLLAKTGRPHGTSAIQRGSFVRKTLLCQELPPAPPDVPELAPAVAGESERQRLERHRRDPACSGCHALLDPLGFGLDGYDAIGAVRTTDEHGQPIDDSGELAGAEQPKFRGGVELGARLRAMPAAAACVAEKMLELALGRAVGPDDAATVAAVQAAFTAAGHELPRLVAAIASSADFRQRRGDDR